MNSLVEEVKALIIDVLNLEDIEPSDIDPDAPLFGDGLGLDSIDALELGVALQKKYDLKIDSDTQDLQKRFYSVKSLTRFIEEGQRA